jgi:hypothetical protein
MLGSGHLSCPDKYVAVGQNPWIPPDENWKSSYSARSTSSVNTLSVTEEHCPYAHSRSVTKEQDPGSLKMTEDFPLINSGQPCSLSVYSLSLKIRIVGSLKMLDENPLKSSGHVDYKSINWLSLKKKQQFAKTPQDERWEISCKLIVCWLSVPYIVSHWPDPWSFKITDENSQEFRAHTLSLYMLPRSPLNQGATWYIREHIT